MNGSVDDVPSKIHRLAIRQLEGTLSDEQRTELTSLLRGDAEARRVYLAHMQDSVSLRWMFNGHYQRDDRRLALAYAEHGSKGVRVRGRRALSWTLLAVAAGLALVAAWPLSPLAKQTVSPPLADTRTATANATASKIATITAVSGVHWEEGASIAKFLSRVSVGQQFAFARGTLELTFDTGAVVKVFGPAKFDITSGTRICCARGRVTTLVGESGKGFTIDTPKARIVDLGTEFGVDISDEGDTQVVVFQGSVDLSPADDAEKEAVANEEKWTRRLWQGEALMLDGTGEAQRVMAVQRSDFIPSAMLDLYGRPRRAPVILDVRDNIRAGESSKCYQIVRGGLREDAPCFVDRSHQWNGIDGVGLPAFLLGADYIMPFNEDKFISDLRVDVKIAQPATCYVFLDDNMSPPDWLKKDFKNTGLDIALDGAKTVWHQDHATAAGPGKSIDFAFSIWSREVSKAGVVTLGGVDPPKIGSRSQGFNMYGIAVVPK